MVDVTLLKPNVMQKLNEMNNNPTKSSKALNHLPSNVSLFLHELSFQMLQKMLRLLGASYIAFWKPDFNKQKDYFYLEMVPHGAIREIIPTHL